MRACTLGLLLAGSVSAVIDIIGYYGNSGNAVASIPKIADINSNYNVVILTFADLAADASISLDLQGPYEKNLPQLALDVKTWKAGKDPFGRKRLALVSIGGQNGRWPSAVTADALEASLLSFFATYNLDGLDIDLEGSAVSAAGSLVPVIKALRSKGFTVTAAPEAAQGPLDGYKNILSLLTWVHPQFYNNGPNAVAAPYLPSAALWPTPWTVTDWQDEKNSSSFWAGVLGAIGRADGLTQAQLGMLIPATPAGAGAYNHWDIPKLAKELQWANVTKVGCWAIAYDNANNYQFANTMAKLNQAL